MNSGFLYIYEQYIIYYSKLQPNRKDIIMKRFTITARISTINGSNVIQQDAYANNFYEAE